MEQAGFQEREPQTSIMQRCSYDLYRMWIWRAFLQGMEISEQIFLQDQEIGWDFEDERRETNQCLWSFCLELDEKPDESNHTEDFENDEDYRDIASELDGKLTESLFIDGIEIEEAFSLQTFVECIIQKIDMSSSVQQTH